jgi:hypothetical protein
VYVSQNICGCISAQMRVDAVQLERWTSPAKFDDQHTAARGTWTATRSQSCRISGRGAMQREVMHDVGVCHAITLMYSYLKVNDAPTPITANNIKRGQFSYYFSLASGQKPFRFNAIFSIAVQYL